MVSKSLDYVVHGVSDSQAPLQVMHEGVSLRATVDSIHVELVDPKNNHGSMLFKFIGQDADDVRSWIKAGDTVTMTLSPKA